MAEDEATGKLEKSNFASELGEQNPDQDKAGEKADAKLLQKANSEAQAVDEGFMDTDYAHVCYDSAEDADDEIDTDDGYEKIRPLNIKKIKNGKASDQVHLSTNHPEQTTQTTASTHHRVEWADNLAKAQKISAEASHTTPIASEHNLPRASVSYSEPLSENPFSDLLHPSPPLRRRKGSMALRKKTSDSATADSTKSQVAENQNASYSHDQDHTADIPEYSVTYLNPTHDGKMSEARGNQNVLSGEHQGKTSEITESSETSTSSENDLLKPKTSGSRKADTVLGYGREGKVTPKKSMTNLVTSPKASREKLSFRKLFHRKGSTECTTPPSSSGTSGKAAGRMTISAPTFVDASPNAKNLLNSAHSLVDASPGAKNVVNYSRPMAHHSSSDVSKGSPVGRGRSSSALPGSNPFSDPSTSPEGLTEKSENGPIGLNTSPIHDHSDASAVRGNQAAEEHGAIAKATEKNLDDSDSDPFNPSDYSGDENSVRQAVALPIVFRGKGKLVNVRPPHGTNTAAPGNGSGVRIATARATAPLTDHDAMILGAQDADRYYANAMNSQTRRTTTNTDHPSIDPAYRKLLAEPANEIAAKEMARIKAAREAEKMGGSLMEGMNALRAESDVKPGAENTGYTPIDPRTDTGESLRSKMRALKKSKQGREQEDSEEEVVRTVEAEKEKALCEEKKIHAIIKAKLAAKDAANEGVRGAGIPRIDYGEPSLRTALGACKPTDEERAHATALENRRAASLTQGRVQKKDGDNTTARGQFEGY